MIMKRIELAAAAGIFLYAASVSANQICYSGSQDSGELRFSSAVEDSGFSGGFGLFDVRYCMAENQPTVGEIVVTVQTGSADSDNNDPDEALLGPEFFDVEQFPVSTWTSQSITADQTAFKADGVLELRGIQAPVAIEFTINSEGDNGSINISGQFQMSGGAQINRQDFKVGTGEFADPEFVRNRVEVTFSLELNQVQVSD